MRKINKILLIIYSIFLFLLLSLFIYINFFNKNIDSVNNPKLLTAIAAFCLGIFKILSNNQNRKPFSFYKKSYEDVIKDSFSDNKRLLKQLLRAIRLYHEDKFGEALNYFEKLSLKVSTNNEKYCVYLFIGSIFSDIRIYTKAIETYEKMLSDGIADSTVLSNLLQCYKKNGNSDKAYDIALKAIHMDPNNYLAYHNYASFLFSEGKYDEAVSYEKKCLELKSNLVEGLTLMFLIYSIQGNETEASVYEKKAVTNGRSKKELKEILDFYLGKDE